MNNYQNIDPRTNSNASMSQAAGQPKQQARRAAAAPRQIVSGASREGRTPNAGKHPDDKKGGHKGRAIVIVIACIAVVVAIIVGVVLSLGNSGFFDNSAQSGQAPYKSKEEIEAELNRMVEEGMMNISIASVIEFPDGESAGTAYIENVPNNHYVMQVDITLDDTGEKVYESGGLKPDSYIENIILARDLEEGTYAATATFHALDPVTLNEVGQAAAKITLNVLG